MSLKKLLAFAFILQTGFASSADIGAPGMVQNKYSPSPVATQWANRGVELANQGDFAAAVEALFEAWKLSPEKTGLIVENLSSALNNYGKQLAERGKDDEAISKLRRAVFFQEENKIPATNLDVLLKKRGINPNDFKARLTEAQKLRANGYVDESVAEYLKAIGLGKTGSSDVLKAKLELAQVYQVIYTKYAANPVGQSRFDKMNVLVQELIKANPKDPKPHILFGRAYLAGDKLPEAIEAFERALKVEAHDRQALDGLVGAWRRVVEIAPNEPDNLIGLGGALMRAGQTDEATQVLQKAKNLSPKNAEIDKMLANTKQSEQEAELYRIAERAFVAQKAGKLDEAIDLYQLALKKLPPTPETANVYYNLGVAYQAKGRTQDAIAAYNQALKFNPANEDAKKALQSINQQAIAARTKQTEKALSLQNAGKLNEAIKIYQELIKSAPNDAQAHFNLGTAYQEANKIPEALQEYKTASKLAPNNSEFSAAAAALQNAMSNGSYKAAQATTVLKEAVNLQQAGKMPQAIAKYQEALKIDPSSAQAHFNYGTALHAANRGNEAVNEYKEAYRLDAVGYPEANYFVGNLLEIQKKYPEALAYYKRYLEDQPKSDYSQAAEERVKLLSAK
jgi:tetratricopeptide (TPR) repeat protein